VQTVEERRGDDLYMGVDEGFGYPTNIFVRR